MGTLKLTLTYATTKNGEEFNGGENYWSGLDDSGAATLLAMAQDVGDLLERNQNKGGPLTTIVSAEVTGGPVPQGFTLAPKTFAGMTLHGYSQVENLMQRIGDKLVKEGQKHATKKEGVRPNEYE